MTEIMHHKITTQTETGVELWTFHTDDAAEARRTWRVLTAATDLRRLGALVQMTTIRVERETGRYLGVYAVERLDLALASRAAAIAAVEPFPI